MKFKDKLELAKSLKATVEIKPFKMEEPETVRRDSRCHPVVICESKDNKTFSSTPATDEFEIFTYINNKSKEQAIEEIKNQKPCLDSIKKEPKPEESQYKNVVIPGITKACPPSPAETKILIDGELVNNIYSIDYAYIYDVDDRTPEQKLNNVPGDEYHVVGWLTIIYDTPAEAATFDCEFIRLVNINTLGQSFDFTIVGVKTVAEVSGINMNDPFMSKVVFFEAKDIVGRVVA